MDGDIGAVAVTGEPAFEIEFSFCSLVTKPRQYREMVKSFQDLGFDKSNSEFLYVDNASGNSDSAYSGLNRLAGFARGKYLVFCHQDLVAIDGVETLRKTLADLTVRDSNWAVAGNAGCDDNVCHFYLNDPNNINVGKDRRQPVKVSSLDENLIILKRKAQIGFSNDLDGFHLYGTDLVVQASLRGRTAYVIDFRVEHLSRGNLDESFFDACLKFERKYEQAFSPRCVQTTCTFIDLGSTNGRGRRTRTRNLERGVGFERPSAKLRKTIQGWATRNSVSLAGRRFFYPRDISVAEFKLLRKGKFEQVRRDLIDSHLPVDVPNVVLGGSYGVVSEIAGQKLDSGLQQIVVEKDRERSALCLRNSSIVATDRHVSVISREVSYRPATTDDSSQFSRGVAEHRTLTAELETQTTPGKVSGITLGQLVQDYEFHEPFSLICNIGGTELDLIEQDNAALSRCCYLLMTLHPGSYYQRGVLVTQFLKMLEDSGFEIEEVAGNHIAAKRIST